VVGSEFSVGEQRRLDLGAKVTTAAGDGDEGAGGMALQIRRGAGGWRGWKGRRVREGSSSV